MSLVANVTDGQVQISESSQSTERKVGSALDKDDFLMLLVAQMKYQDPLEPTSNTEYVAQLAQFSELEQMQNLNQTTVNTSAYSLVGKEVYIAQESLSGTTSEVQGTVEYVTIQNGEAYVSVNGELYAYEDVTQVIDEYYLLSQKIPSVKSQSHSFLHHDPQDVVISGVSLGEDGYQATGMAIVLIAEDGTSYQIPSANMTYKDGTLTIDKEALSGVVAGEYSMTFVFDDVNETINYDSVTLTVKGNYTSTESSDSNTEDAEQAEDNDAQ